MKTLMKTMILAGAVTIAAAGIGGCDSSSSKGGTGGAGGKVSTGGAGGGGAVGTGGMAVGGAGGTAVGGAGGTAVGGTGGSGAGGAGGGTGMTCGVAPTTSTSPAHSAIINADTTGGIDPSITAATVPYPACM